MMNAGLQKVLYTIYWFFFSWFNLSDEDRSEYKLLIAKLDTPMKVQAWLWANMKYVEDKKMDDSWQTAEKTFSRRRGDCEDWAVMANACLRYKYKGQFLCMYTADSGHATYLIETGDKSYTSLGTFGMMKHHGDIGDIIKDWKGYRSWTHYVIRDENQKKVIKVIR